MLFLPYSVHNRRTTHFNSFQTLIYLFISQSFRSWMTCNTRSTQQSVLSVGRLISESYFEALSIQAMRCRYIAHIQLGRVKMQHFSQYTFRTAASLWSTLLDFQLCECRQQWNEKQASARWNTYPSSVPCYHWQTYNGFQLQNCFLRTHLLWRNEILKDF